MESPYEEPIVVSEDAIHAELMKTLSPAQKVESESLFLGKILGAGAFGEVIEGRLDHSFQSDGGTVKVAVKRLQMSASGKDRIDFLREAYIMAQWDHPRIVSFFGFCVGERPMIVLELAQSALDAHLRANGESVSSHERARWALDIASAMEYLAARGYVHRDLASRNALLVGTIAKLADFGRSRAMTLAQPLDMDEEEVYASVGGLVPVRWTAPEALMTGVYSTATDVWAFGILLYELFSNAVVPYGDELTNKDVFKQVDQGYRLPPPRGCPRHCYDLMARCWHPHSACRPRFREIRTALHDAVHLNPTLLETLADPDGATAAAAEQLGQRILNAAKDGHLTLNETLDKGTEEPDYDHELPEMMRSSSAEACQRKSSPGMHGRIPSPIDHSYDEELPEFMQRTSISPTGRWSTNDPRPSAGDHPHGDSSIRPKLPCSNEELATQHQHTHLEPDLAYPDQVAEGTEGYSEPQDAYSECADPEPAPILPDDKKADRMSRWIEDFETRKHSPKGALSSTQLLEGKGTSRTTKVMSWFGSVGRRR